MQRDQWLCYFGGRALDGGQVTWDLALSLPLAYSEILDKSSPFLDLSLPIFTMRGVMSAELKGWLRSIWWPVDVVYTQGRGQRQQMPLAGMGPWEGGFGEGDKFICKHGVYKICREPFGDFGDSSGGGKFRPFPQIHASPWKLQQCPTYPGPLRESV